MSRFYRNLILVIVMIGLIIFLLVRFMENYTTTMRNVYSPEEFEEHDEPEEDSDTNTYVPPNSNER